MQEQSAKEKVISDASNIIALLEDKINSITTETIALGNIRDEIFEKLNSEEINKLEVYNIISMYVKSRIKINKDIGVKTGKFGGLYKTKYADCKKQQKQEASPEIIELAKLKLNKNFEENKKPLITKIAEEIATELGISKSLAYKNISLYISSCDDIKIIPGRYGGVVRV